MKEEKKGESRESYSYFIEIYFAENIDFQPEENPTHLGVILVYQEGNGMGRILIFTKTTFIELKMILLRMKKKMN